MRKSSNPLTDAELRLRAEKRFKGKQRSQRPGEAVRGNVEDTQALFQELQIHQIELEMQKEELRQKQTELQTLLSQYTDLYDFAPIGFFTLDRAGAIRRVNLAGADLLGEERARLANRPFRLFVSAGDRPVFDDFLLQVFSNQAILSANKIVCEVALCRGEDHPPASAFSWCGYSSAVSRRHVRIEVRTTEGGKECLATVNDITEYKRNIKELNTAKDFLDTVFDTLTDSLIVVDPATYAILSANKKFLDFCGLDKDAVIGKHCCELYNHGLTLCSPLDDICPLGETLKTGKPSTMEHIHHDSTGRRLYVEVSTVPIISTGGEIRQIIHLSRNITDRKQAEQVLRQQRVELSQVSRLATIGEFAASIAHEVHQPLTAILNNAQAVQRFLSSDTPAIDEVRDALQDIINDNKRASEVVRRFRSFLKRDGADRTILDINAVIGEVLTILNREIVYRNARITPVLSLDIPHVEGDCIGLQQVLMNLILNAIDSMMNVDSQLRQMYIRTSVDEPNSIIVAVQDSGTGLDTNEIDRVFETFYTTKREGLGMGLSISKSIIVAHGGRIWAENNPEGGATFYFTLPVYKGKAL